jgi:hypothetical protein
MSLNIPMAMKFGPPEKSSEPFLQIPAKSTKKTVWIINVESVPKSLFLTFWSRLNAYGISFNSLRAERSFGRIITTKQDK